MYFGITVCLWILVPTYVDEGSKHNMKYFWAFPLANGVITLRLRLNWLYEFVNMFLVDINYYWHSVNVRKWTRDQSTKNLMFIGCKLRIGFLTSSKVGHVKRHDRCVSTHFTVYIGNKSLPLIAFNKLKILKRVQTVFVTSRLRRI